MSKFKILWIDDQPDKVGLEIHKVESLIIEKGLTPVIDLIQDVSNVNAVQVPQWLQKLRSRDYDLLLVDFNLRCNVFGSDVIKSVRINNNIYVDIVFYSSDRDSLIEKVIESYNGPMLDFIDDIHIMVLDDADFNEKIEGVVNKIIGSWYNAHSIRGIILGKASKFESLVSEIVKKNYVNQKGLLLERLMRKKDTVCSSVNSRWEALNNEDDPIVYAIDHPDFFNWSVRKMLFNTLVECGQIRIDDASFSKNLDELFEIRNKFAHNKLKVENGKVLLNVIGVDQEYDEEKINEIICKINGIEDVLYSLID